MRILVADDSRVMRQIVIRTLRQAGYGGADIAEAENGLIAADMAAQAPFDIILSDWNMPEMTGIESLRHLRACGNTTPFGFVTSEGSAQMRDQAAAAGALFLIAKPFDAETFAEALNPVLG